MARRTENKIILIKRKTRLQELVVRHNTVAQACFYIEHLGGDFSDYLTEDTRYRAALAQVEEILAAAGRLQVVDREYLPNFIFGKDDTVVAVGPDGLVANTLKYLDGQPLIGVNPDAGRWDGVLLPFAASDLITLLPDVFCRRRPLREVSMAKASLNDGQVLYGVNDLFIGQRTHISSRYRICQGDIAENQSSSGIIVSTGLGASGWLKSIVAGARGILATMGTSGGASEFCSPPWNADYLHFTVREPFPSHASAASVVFGRITPARPMQITSYMPEGGVIFSDGIENDFLVFCSGMQATITLAEKKGYLVV